MNRIINFLTNLLFCGVIAYVVYTSIFGERGLKNYLKLRKEKVKLEKQLKKTEEERDNLAEELALIKKDPLYIEEQIKLKLQKGKKGEVFYIFQEKDGELNDHNNGK
ncbi:MAG: septum formation initiator family protein [Proteobacteria bacterium]|nr:septum formation initiator family protein [Pseudomonadota bacterium]